MISLAFSSDGRRLVAGSTDQTIALWDLSTHPLRADLFAQPGDTLKSVSLHPQSGRLAVGNQAGEVRLRDIGLAAWKQPACERVNRNLTPDEWAQYLGDLPYRETC